MIEVVAPGLHSSVQDRGRSGYYAVGVPPSGAMDLFAHDAANALVGNAPDAAGLEITFLGPTLTFQVATVIAVTGATVDVAFSNGRRIPLWTSQLVRAGQTVRFAAMSSGARAYLAVRGGIDTPVVMGSRSTYSLSGLGGLDGRTLRAGDLLQIGTDVLPGSRHRPGVQVPDELRPTYPAEQEIRVVPGLCDYRLTGEATEVLYSTPYAVTVEANRTGYRFQGEPLAFLDRTAPFGAGHDPSNVVNLGYPVGSIQAPSGTELICLLRDAVTGGGYATIGTVISADLDLIAQSKAPDQVLFRPVSVETALAERAVRARRLAAIRQLALI
ncbi:biotin-dependent carboxyltransferase family protein [Actinomadura formosensis]|uniref:5-oxoprolinase subunit C family protein n=1 Tax=Actinomadura formosensis TaxID=60706 RepID=UPI003D901754